MWTKHWATVPRCFALGVLIHIAGDAITEHGVPILAPFVRIRGCRWRRFGLPGWLAFRTGGWQEKVLSVGMVGGGAFAGWVLLTG